MPIRVYKVADIIDGEMLFSQFAKKTAPDETHTFGDVARSALMVLYPPGEKHFHYYIECLKNT